MLEESTMNCTFFTSHRISKWIQHSVLALTLSFTITGCNSSGNNEATFATFNDVNGSILNVTEHHLRGQLVDVPAHEKMTICVKTSEQFYPANKLILEVKLGLAMWLKSSEISFISLLDQLKFERECDLNSQSDSRLMNIIVPVQDPSTFDSTQKERFPQPTAECSHLGQGISCTNRLTLAYARMTAYGKSGNLLKKFIPSEIVFNPYVRWDSLDLELQSLEKPNLVQNYLMLLQRQSNNTLEAEEIVEFADQLMNEQLVEKNRSLPPNIFESIPTGGELESVAYQPESASFSTLLHELGHTMGLAHADHLNGTEITGSTEGLADPSTPFLTSEAVMAYGERYLYLKEDDLAGLEHVISRF